MPSTQAELKTGGRFVHDVGTAFARSLVKMRRLVRETAVEAAAVQPRTDVTSGSSEQFAAHS